MTTTTKLTKAQQQTLTLIQEQPRTSAELQELLGIKHAGVSKHLKALRTAGLIKHTGEREIGVEQKRDWVQVVVIDTVIDTYWDEHGLRHDLIQRVETQVHHEGSRHRARRTRWKAVSQSGCNTALDQETE